MPLLLFSLTLVKESITNMLNIGIFVFPLEISGVWGPLSQKKQKKMVRVFTKYLVI